MQIKMLEDCRISEDGFIVRKLMKGEIYDIAHSAACHIINNGWGIKHA